MARTFSKKGTLWHRLYIIESCTLVGGLVVGGVASFFVPPTDPTFFHLGTSVGAIVGLFQDPETW